MSEIRERIVGSEMEYSVFIKRPGLERPVQFAPEGYFLTEYLAASGMPVNTTMLGNGGRFYIDYNGYIEYATPEERTFAGMMLREFAGERLVMGAVADYVRKHKDIITMEVQKRVVDRKGGDTSGYHVNLLADRTRIKDMDPKTMRMLALHMAVNQPLFGAGAIISNHIDGAQYSFSQKLPGLSIDFGKGTHTNGSKPLINTRDEPHAESSLYRRIHLTSADPHISPWATEVFTASLSLVLRAIEQGKASKFENTMGSSILSLGRLSTLGISGTDAYAQRWSWDGRPMDSIHDIRETILEIVSGTEHTDEEARLLREWRTAHNDYNRDPMSIADRSDAIGRLAYIQQCNKLRGHAPNDFDTTTALTADLTYGSIYNVGLRRTPIDQPSPEVVHRQSRPYKLRTTSMARRMPTEEAINEAIHNPPEDTRAFGRAAVIRSGGATSMGWAQYQLDRTTIKMPNPYAVDGQFEQHDV